MSNLVVTAVLALSVGGVGQPKRATLTVTGPASYDTNGSVLDLSSANTVLTGLDSQAAFVRVDAVVFGGVTAHASDVYRPAYVRAASGAPATGTVKVRDLAGAADAEVASTTDLHTTVWVVEVLGS